LLKAVIFFLLCITLFCGCETNKTQYYKDKGINITLPDDDTVNGYRQSQNDYTASEEQTHTSSNQSYITSSHKEVLESVYYANTNSKKFHRPSCGLGVKIKDENLYVTDSRQELIDKDYEPCGRCNP